MSLEGIGIGLSVSGILTIIFILIFIFRAKDSHLIRDDSGYPSLAKFQLISWTIIISFSYLAIYLARIIDGVAFPPPDFPAEVAALMGISVVSTAVNKKLSDDKYDTANAQFEPVGKGYKTMLEENQKLELTRLQMFLWTIISLIIYISLLASTFINNVNDVKNLQLPNIDPMLVALMGLSQAGYLGYKAAIPQQEIHQIIQAPGRTLAAANAARAPLPITITGKNFGNLIGEVDFSNTRLEVADITEWD